MPREPWQRNLVGVLIAAFVSILGFNLVFPFLPLYIQTLGDYDDGAAAFWTGVIGLTTGVAGAIAALVWGQLADRHGRRPMLIRATAGAAAGLVVMGLAGNIWHLLGGRLAFSALAGTVPAANPLLAANTPPEHLPAAMGMLQSAVFLSNTLGPLFGGVLTHFVGYRLAFLLTAALYVLSAFPVLWLVRERFTPPTTSRGLARGVAEDFSEVMRTRAIIYPILAVLLALAGANVSLPLLSLLIREMVGAEQAELAAGGAFFVQGITSTASALLLGRLLARFGHQRLLAATAPASVVVYLLLWIVPSYPLLVTLLGVQGLIQGAQIPALNTLIAARAPRHRVGAVFGVVSSINSLAFSGGPFIGGTLASVLGLRAVFPVSALLLLLMLLVVGKATRPVAETPSSQAPALADEPP